MTSRQTEPELDRQSVKRAIIWRGHLVKLHISSMLGWKIRLTKPMLGLLYGYESGSSTWIFHSPPLKGATWLSPVSSSAGVAQEWERMGKERTFFWALETDVEFLPVEPISPSCFPCSSLSPLPCLHTLPQISLSVYQPTRYPGRRTVIVDKCHFVIAHQPARPSQDPCVPWK